jgi:outer membrane receptor protein involved in Fe transport
MINRKGLLLATLTALFASVIALGQTTTATLSGVVKDATGAVVTDVKITARNADTGATRDARTDSDGRYSLTNLGPGQYDIRAERAGFKTAAQSGVTLNVGGATVLDLTIQIGEVSEVVEVKQEEPLIEPTKAELSRVVNERSIESLPIIGRNFVDFAKLASGVAPGRENTGGGAFKEPDAGVGSAAAPRLTFGGQSELSTLILVDGADNIQNATGLPRVTPSQEAVREFRVLSSTFLAEYGRALGGFVNIVTKSGTNRFNGSAYYFGLNDALNAQPILTPDPRLRQNQYGATIGGPLRKDKTFFFGNYEGQRRAESNKFSSVIINNLDAINATKAFFGLSPETTNVLRANDYDGFLTKLDHKITSNNDFSVRYNLLDSTTNGFLGGGGRASAASTTRRNNEVLDQSVVASETALLGSHVVNEARVQWARRSFDFPAAVKEPDLEVSNLLITGKTTSDMDFYGESRLQLTDNLSVVTGGHALKFGTDFNHIRNTSQLDLFFPARVIFPSLPAFLAPSPTPVVFWWGLANGTTTRAALPIPFTQSVPSDIAPLTTTRVNHNSYGFYGQDEWKATSNLTLTLGLRYDFETYPQPFVLQRDMNNFQPRVGLAYSFSPRTVLRAGFGIFNDRQFTSIGQQLTVVQLGSAGDLPNANVVFPGVAPIRGLFVQPTVNGGAGTLAQPATTTCFPGGPTIMTTSVAQLATCIFTTTGQVPAAPMAGGPGFRDNKGGSLRTPYSEHASLEISRELGGGVAVTVGYIYVHGLKLPAHTGLLNGVQTGTLINGAVVQGVVPGGKPVFNRQLGGRQFPELGDFYVTDDIGFSIHHGGTFEVEKRFSRGFSFHGSYTFSKTINNAESVANLADLPEGPSIGTERAVSRQTVPHRFTLAFVSQIPERAAILGKFKFSSLLSVQSGRRFNIFAGSDANGDGNPLSDRPGNLGRNTLEGPGFASFDMRVAREFRINDRVTAEFSADFFNLFNRVNITDLNTVYGALTLDAPPQQILGFNTPRDASNPFQFQYGLKIRF